MDIEVLDPITDLSEFIAFCTQPMVQITPQFMQQATQIANECAKLRKEVKKLNQIISLQRKKYEVSKDRKSKRSVAVRGGQERDQHPQD